ncbi:hypothetical protein FISHEDRAFT_76531 [Fistulina hepatica ATCC 64428]|uniref:Uncharacterized protein n=1 Tax=Fistulina hepatica ATCC 64428 TaxID=1128425 RepID=A0A0D7A2X3_9AGAR|nr:hypothetical protein FISHEDRAFT_76531 [Fistulina hepatica ATCC 64428]
MSLHTAVPATPITPTIATSDPYSASILKSPIVSAPSVSDVASSSHVVSSTAPTPGSVVAKARRSKKRRLIHNGANYLREYLASLNGEWPNKRQLVKDRVLEHVQTLCGNEECELDNIVQWFARQKAHQKRQAPILCHVVTSTRVLISPPTDSEIRGRPPKEVLKESARTHLDNLLSDTPNPTIQTITSWAGLMGADVSDVMAYIACRSTTRLPTPAESISTSVGAYSPAESPFLNNQARWWGGMRY